MITVETERLVVIRRPGASVVAPCAGCGERVEMVTPAEAARRARITCRAIYRRVESGTLHFVEAGEGSLLICLNSLAGPEPTSEHSESSALRFLNSEGEKQ